MELRSQKQQEGEGTGTALPLSFCKEPPSNSLMEVLLRKQASAFTHLPRKEDPREKAQLLHYLAASWQTPTKSQGAY